MKSLTRAVAKDLAAKTTERVTADVLRAAVQKHASVFLTQSRLPIRATEVSVFVVSPDKTLAAEKSETIAPVPPRLLLYENHPLYGLRFEKVLNGAFALQGDETRISAVPFFFETKTRSARSPLSFTWSLNFASLEREKTSELTLRRSSSRGGRAELAVEARNEEPKSFQTARAAMNITMGENN